MSAKCQKRTLRSTQERVQCTGHSSGVAVVLVSRAPKSARSDSASPLEMYVMRWLRWTRCGLRDSSEAMIFIGLLKRIWLNPRPPVGTKSQGTCILRGH